MLTKTQTDGLVGAFGLGFMNGYFTGRIIGLRQQGDANTVHGQVGIDRWTKLYADFMTDNSMIVVAARFRTFCADPNDALGTLNNALGTWLTRFDR